MEALSEIPGNWECDIVGGGEMGSTLKETAERLGISGKVNFAGAQNHDRVFEFIRRADVFVLPSRWDGWGAVVNEALLSGVPVVCSDAAGASCVLDGELGAAFPCGDPVELRKALERQIRLGPVSPEKRERIRALAETRISATAAAKFLREEILTDAK